MKSGEVIKAAKQWFRLSNYNVLQEITLNDLSDELSRRAVLFRYDSTNEQSPRYQRYLEEEAKILAGTPLLISSTKTIPHHPKRKTLWLMPRYMFSISPLGILAAMRQTYGNSIYSNVAMLRLMHHQYPYQENRVNSD
ncbi:DUF6387 family protein [Pectobacterium polaris]|jgi:hypothetical protein|uniref:DUF6387 family protein n=1 Tax=Pectobacterium polaris TaxID=2042057 RepID=UPI00280AED4C|nr:DUF6387 family protein [Pectobacterium polaris]